MVNLIMVLRLQRIGGNRHARHGTAEAGEVMARLGSDLRWLSMQLLACTTMGEQQDVAPGASQHGMAASRRGNGTATKRAASDKGHSGIETLR